MWLALGFLVYFALKSKSRTMQDNGRSSRPGWSHREDGTGSASSRQADSGNASAAEALFGSVAGTRAGVARKAAEEMVQCAHCQLYVPVSEAVSGRVGADAVLLHFCCEEHRVAGE